MYLEWLREVSSTVGTYIVAPILLSTVALAIIKISEWIKQRRLHHAIQITAEKNDRIQELLTEIRILLNCERAYLSLFHNGFKYVDGSEVLKKSRTNESVSPGVTYDAQYYQNVNISLVPDEMKLISDVGPNFRRTEDLADGKFKRMLVSRGIKAVARCAVKKGSDIIGFLGIDYINDRDPPKNIDDLCKYAGIIEQVLSTYR